MNESFLKYRLSPARRQMRKTCKFHALQHKKSPLYERGIAQTLTFFIVFSDLLSFVAS